MSDFLFKAQTYCAKAERCEQDVKRRLWAWNVPQEEKDTIIQSLKSDGFIDENRYAAAFVHDKTNLSGWGLLKIRNALLRKGISADIISVVLEDYDLAGESDKLTAQLQSKAHQLLRSTRFATLAEIDADDCTFEQRQLLNDFRNRLLRFAVSRGFDITEASRQIEMLKTQVLN